MQMSDINPEKLREKVMVRLELARLQRWLISNTGSISEYLKSFNFRTPSKCCHLIIRQGQFHLSVKFIQVSSPLLSLFSFLHILPMSYGHLVAQSEM